MKMADLKKQLMEFLETIRAAHKIFLKNGRLMASIASFTTLAYSLLLLTNFLSLRPLVSDLIAKQTFLLVTSPSSAEFANLIFAIQKDLQLFFGAEWVFLLAYSASSVLFSSATIIASAVSHTGDQDFPCRPRDVALAAARCLKRPLVTYFYVSIFGAGYVMILLAILLPFALPGASVVTSAILVLAILFYTYLSVVWTMGMVVSVLEEKSGMEALGKAGQLVKGALHLKGYGIGLVVTLLSYGVMQIWKVAGIGSIGSKSSSYVQLLVGMVIVNAFWLMTMYGLMGFTVLYYEGKRNHGEETEAVLVAEYTKISSLPLIDDNLP